MTRVLLVTALLLLPAALAAQTTSNSQAISGVGTSATPAAAVCNGALWLAWKGQDTDTAIYVAPSYTGAKPAVAAGSTVASPYGGTIENPNYYLLTPQSKVTDATDLPNVIALRGVAGARNAAGTTFKTVTPSTDTAPALACLGDTLYLLWRNSSDRVLYWTQSQAPSAAAIQALKGAAPPLSWGSYGPVNLAGVQAPSLQPNPPPPPIVTAKTSAAPSASAGSGNLYLAFRGDADNKIYFATFNRTSNLNQWSAAKLLRTAGPTANSQAIGTPLTSDTPAILATDKGVLVVWKADSSQQLYWSQIAPVPVAPPGTFGAGQPVFNLPAGAIAWAETKIPGATSPVGPALALDGNGVPWISWIPAPGVITGGNELFPPIAFASLLSGQGAYGGGAWSIPALRVGTPTGLGTRPALVATGGDSRGLVLVWKNPATEPGITLGPLRLPAITYTISIQSVTAVNTRSGSIASHLGPFSVDSKDTDFISLTASVAGGTAEAICSCNASPGRASGAWMLGNLANGETGQPQDLGPNGLPGPVGGDISVTVPDDDQIAFNYFATNYGEGTASSAVQLLQMVSQKLATAGASALASAAGSALGASVGAAIGTGTIPLVGSGLGALAGWAVGDAWGVAFPGCDGPVAAAMHAYSAYDLYLLTSSTAPPTSPTSGPNLFRPHSFTEVDVHPAPGSARLVTQAGCGSNPVYQVQWTISRGNLVAGHGSSD